MYMYYSCVYATIQDVVEPQMRGIAMSVYFFVFYIFTAIGLVFFGQLSDARSAAALAGGATAADARAFGLHDALYVVPVVSVLVSLVLFVGSRSANADQARVQAPASSV
jgi:hypothetical protein